MEQLDFTRWYAQQKPNPKLLENRLTYLIKECSEDSLRVEKLKILQKKLNNFEWCLAFCGHFSAGKSTLINTILEQPLLPNSPIPTSANIVTIQKGKDIVEVLDESGEIFSFHQLDDVSVYAKDNEVKQIHLFLEQFPLPESFVLMDTPGLDSTIESHQSKTLEHLFIADVVVYVMDYRHVESKENIEKIRKMNTYDKDVILVVNQIDKHVETELSFQDYKEQVILFLKNYELDHLPLYFISLKDFKMKENEWKQLVKQFSHMIMKRKQTVIQTITKALYALIKEHESFLLLQYKDELESLSKELLYREPSRNLFQKIVTIEEELKRTESNAEKFTQITGEKMKRLLWYANLMPYQTREKVRDFIDAYQVDFRMKGLFSKRKTEKEREKRLNLLIESLNENAFIYLMKPTKELLTEQFTQYRILTEQTKEKIEAFQIKIDDMMIVSTFKSSALYSEAYIAQFCRDITNNIHRYYRKLLLPFIEEGKQLIERSSQFERKRYEKQLIEIKKRWQINVQLESIEKRVVKKIEHYKEKTLMKSIESLKFPEERVEMVLNRLNNQRRGAHLIDIETTSQKITRTSFKASTYLNEKKIIERTKKSISLVQTIPSLTHFVSRLLRKIERVEQKKYTLVLFGAFSSGKSSFVNALIGEEIVPVSPHPTTATIHKICPTEPLYPHQTVLVHYKTEDEVISELNEMLKFKNRKITSLEELEMTILEGEQSLFFQSMELHWLQTVNRYFRDHKSYFGKSITISLEAFKAYMNQEKYAAFIKEVQLFYDCTLTREGIILVDTPGVDSVHLRHTETAFTFLTESDALFYVMYYNHSFTKYDLEFLRQVGRVKEQFDREKIFFLLNASDLAENEEEILVVVQHLLDNLHKIGVKKANIYPISSHYEKNHLKEYSGFQSLTTELISFIKGELQKEVLNQIKNETERMKRTIEKWYHLSTEQQSKREEIKKQLVQAEKEALNVIQSVTFKTEMKLLKEEVHELMFYVKQRIFYRYYDEFKIIFSAQQLKAATSFELNLKQCVVSMLQFLQFELMQEMKATSFRIHMYLQQLLTILTKTMNDELHFIRDDLRVESLENSFIVPPKLTNVFTGIEVEQFNQYYVRYKNPTEFFVRNGDVLLREAFEKAMREPLRLYIAYYQSFFKETYKQQLKEHIPLIKENYKKQLKDYFSGEIDALSLAYSPGQLKGLLQALQ